MVLPRVASHREVGAGLAGSGRAATAGSAVTAVSNPLPAGVGLARVRA